MKNQFYKLFVLILIIPFLYHGSPPRTYIVPSDSSKYKKKPKKEKLLPQISEFFLPEIFQLLNEASELSEKAPLLQRLEKAMDLLRKEYKKSGKKIPGLDCIKKAIYNIKNDKLELAIKRNIPKAIVEIYRSLDSNKLKKLKFFLSRPYLNNSRKK